MCKECNWALSEHQFQRVCDCGNTKWVKAQTFEFTFRCTKCDALYSIMSKPAQHPVKG